MKPQFTTLEIKHPPVQGINGELAVWLQYVFLPEFTASKCPLIVPLLNQLSGIVPKDGYYNSSTVTIGRDFHYKPQYLPLLFYSHLKLQIEWQCDVHAAEDKFYLSTSLCKMSRTTHSAGFMGFCPQTKGKICRRRFARQLEFINQNGWATVCSGALLVSVIISMNKHQ